MGSVKPYSAFIFQESCVGVVKNRRQRRFGLCLAHQNNLFRFIFKIVTIKKEGTQIHSSSLVKTSNPR